MHMLFISALPCHPFLPLPSHSSSFLPSSSRYLLPSTENSNIPHSSMENRIPAFSMVKMHKAHRLFTLMQQSHKAQLCDSFCIYATILHTSQALPFSCCLFSWLLYIFWCCSNIYFGLPGLINGRE